ncbi:uncharacterized protein [Diadema antillarum]|uniref:uncharacterized protein n=1 Tax=Diadema antillarum TaxID=105358 RepID=UPI003A892E59
MKLLFINLQGIPSVKLIDGHSHLDGLLVTGSGNYVCFDGFSNITAKLVCKELGFPAAKEFSGQILTSKHTAAGRRVERLSCSNGSLRLDECLSTTIECSSNRAVRLKCREPGFLGCYKDNEHEFQAVSNFGFGVHSDEECISTCLQYPVNYSVAVMHQEGCMCFQSEVYTTALSGGSFSHNWTCPLRTQLESDQFYSFILSVGFCDHPGIVPNGVWDSNITRFGSKITLACGREFVVNGSATMQCMGLPGRSTYFPVWNTSTPSCREARKETNDDEWEDVNVSIKPTQRMQNTSNVSTLIQQVGFCLNIRATNLEAPPVTKRTRMRTQQR